jgi:ABC-type transport system substrate-binding protein
MTLRALFAGVAVAASCSACQGIAPPIGERRDIEPERGGTLNMANYTDVRNLDPALAFDAATAPIEQLLYAPLVDYDRSGRIVPLLAERYDVSEDGRRIAFKLREGALFHDGDEVSADDVKRSIERTLHHDTPCPAPSFYASIAGYRAFHDGTKDEHGTLVFAPHLDGVVVDGRYALHFDLSEPDATFLAALTLYFVAPLCKSAGSTYAREWGNHACGAGPFRLVEWQVSRELTFVRHQGYFEHGLPYLDRIRWQQLMPASTQRFKFEDGDLDHLRQFSVADLTFYLKDPRWKPYGQWEPAKEVNAIFLNTQMKPFDNVELRRAFAAAIDWHVVTSVRPEFGVATQVVPPAVPGHDPDFAGQTYDLAAALEHMKNAGYPYDPVSKKGGYPGTVTFKGPAETSITESIAPMVQQQVARIGIKMEIVQVSYPAHLALASRRGNIQLGYGGWSMDYPDASDFFEPNFSSSSIQDEEAQNYSFYSNAELDGLLERAHHELDPAARRSMYRRCEEIVRDDVPWAIGYNQRWYEIVQPYVHGFVTDAKHTEDVRFVWIDSPQRKHAARRSLTRDALALIRPWGRR